jgi:pimeloyl-ACP methyl ester carboxylesterase
MTSAGSDRGEAVRLPLPDGGWLAGDYVPGSTANDFAVVWIHGFGSHRGGEKAAALRAECGRRGWAFAAFDFRGHGASSGTMRELRPSRLLEDLAAVRQFLAGRGLHRLGLVGSSMGGFAAAWFAVQQPEVVVGCVLLASGFRFPTKRWDALTPEQREAWQRTGVLRVTNEWVDTEVGYGLVEERDLFRLDELTRRWQTPALLFHGLRDDIVPDTDSLEFLRRTSYPNIELRLLKNGDHRLTAYKDEIAAAAGHFFARLLGDESSTGANRSL